MKEIKHFTNKKEYNFENTFTLSGKVATKMELYRPGIFFNNKSGKTISEFSENIMKYEKQLIDYYFSRAELKFLSKHFDIPLFNMKNFKNEDILTTSNEKINPLYTSPAIITLMIDENNDEYVIITFSRWQFENQPRGAGEDSLGEDITYVHGIWEDPLLTDDIINKIKGI